MPEGLGTNWDSLDECLRDLSWVEERKIVLYHRDIPLEGSLADQQIYLDVLGRFDRMYPTPLPYISALHQYTNSDEQREGYFHVELMSVRRSATKLKFLAGSESAMDAFISDVTPESVAQRLRELG